jgi:hypothetical protein
MFTTNMSGAQASLEDEIESGAILDIVVINLSCVEDNTTCSAWRPANFVEYFTSDNCEPCGPVEQQLANRDLDTTFIMSHHPSDSNDFWLNASKIRFQETYFLWGYPSLIIDGQGLLAGKTQAQELDSVISNSTMNYSGIDQARFENGTLSINYDVADVNIDVWTVKSYSYQGHDYTNLAINHSRISINNSSVDTNGDHLVIVMSEPGQLPLEMVSSIPPTGYLPDGGIGKAETLSQIDTSTIVIITALLAILILPATVELIRLIRQKPPDFEQE